MKRITLSFLSVFLMISLQACLFDNGSDNEDPGEPFINGVITDIEVDNQRILVEENPDVNDPLEEGGNKIWLSVNEDTSIFRNNNFELIHCTFDCFSIDLQVSAWITGDVAESYPLQGTATRVVITGNPSNQ